LLRRLHRRAAVSGDRFKSRAFRSAEFVSSARNQALDRRPDFRLRFLNNKHEETSVLAHTASMQQRAAMYNANAFKIGLFGANCSSGRSATKVPERWSASWPDCLKLAKLADDAGIDFMLPIGRWKGYGGDTNFHGSTLETVTWAAGLLAATKHITVFGTVHAPLFNPIIAAKEFVTVDHIGEGRFGINLVVGWNEGEFDMFGVSQRQHDDRYDYAQEWLDVIKRAWTDHDDFDFAGQYLSLKGVRAFPKPYGDTRPIIMNAGRSGVGQSFALKNCDAFFTATVDSRHSIEANAKKVDEIKSAAAAIGREIDVYTVGQVVCRPTQKEADDYYHYAQVDNADWGAIEQMMALKNVTRQTVTPEVYAQQQQYYATKAIGGFPFVGSPDRVAEELANISRAGLRGIAVSFVNYLNEVPYFCDEVLPRLARFGIRRA
jgi:alkanesulfonate monooxygenase SsuD/methylene tetrahydromethanopterin reductase-like flavin-dependent oxidoreductase (luciferase family)